MVEARDEVQLDVYLDRMILPHLIERPPDSRPSAVQVARVVQPGGRNIPAGGVSLMALTFEFLENSSLKRHRMA